MTTPSKASPPRVWADANLFVRLVTDDPASMAERAEAFLSRAEAGEFTLVVAPVVVAECVWVLTSVYRLNKDQIAVGLTRVLSNAGLVVLDRDQTLGALALMAEKNVDFVDAFLAAFARSAGDAVASFDDDFRRLVVQRVRIE